MVFWSMMRPVFRSRFAQLPFGVRNCVRVFTDPLRPPPRGPFFATMFFSEDKGEGRLCRPSPARLPAARQLQQVVVRVAVCPRLDVLAARAVHDIEDRDLPVHACVERVTRVAGFDRRDDFGLSPVAAVDA